MHRRRQGFRLKGIKRYSNAGSEYCYHRATGTRLPAHLPENDPEFMAAYLAAVEVGKAPSKTRSGPDSVEAMANRYMRSDAHKNLSQSYRRVRERDIDKLIEKAGGVAIRNIKEVHVRKDIMSLQPHPANERLKTWRAVLKFTRQEGYRDDDPSEFIKRRETPNAIPHEPWTIGDKEVFRNEFPIGTRERLAMEVLNWTGARMSDVVRFTDAMLDREGWLNFKQQKTGGEVSVPVNRALPSFVDPADLAMLIECLGVRAERPMWLTTAFGTSRSPKSASQWFAAGVRKAGIVQKTAHGLRKTRAIELAEAGATTMQIGAWTGHESLKEIEHYTRKSNKKRLLSSTDREQKSSKARGY